MMLIDPYRFAVASAYAVWHPTAHAATITISGGGLVATGSGTLGLGIARADIALSGSRYFEVSYVPNGNGVGPGVYTSSGNLNNYLGQNSDGACYYLPSGDTYINAAVYHNGPTDTTTPVIIGIAFVSSTRSGWVRNAAGTGWVGGGDPTTGTTPTFIMAAGTYYPACTPYTAGAGACTLNAGQSAFAKWTPSGGFSGVS